MKQCRLHGRRATIEATYSGHRQRWSPRSTRPTTATVIVDQPTFSGAQGMHHRSLSASRPTLTCTGISIISQRRDHRPRRQGQLPPASTGDRWRGQFIGTRRSGSRSPRTAEPDQTPSPAATITSRAVCTAVGRRVYRSCQHRLVKEVTDMNIKKQFRGRPYYQ